MKAEQAQRFTHEALEKLSAALEAGASEELRRYLAVMARFHRYSFTNSLLIAMQRPDATHVAGYRAWQKLGRQVRKGERGITIFAPMRIRAAEGGEGAGDEDAETLLRFKAVRVFDIAQTDGEPLPERTGTQGDPGPYLDRLTALVAARGIALAYSDDLGGADGTSSGGVIHLRSGLPPAEAFSVLVHELAHEMLHHVAGAERPPKTVRETEAEAVAYVVSEAVGLETGTASSDYIHLYRGDKKTLADSLGRIHGAATAIIEGIAEPPG